MHASDHGALGRYIAARVRHAAVICILHRYLYCNINFRSKNDHTHDVLQVRSVSRDWEIRGLDTNVTDCEHVSTTGAVVAIPHSSEHVPG
jgi:hypothetical protein